MIFLSHNYKDKDVVGPIAVNLANKYGHGNVFYDSWSIKPGDGIIAEMNKGLEKCRFFFFFVSQNSLNSGMVSLEWQAALHKSVSGDMRFVAVKIDNSNQPVILIDKLYIDMYNTGIDETFQRMSDVIDNKISMPYNAIFENVYCEITIISKLEVLIAIKVRRFVEHDPDIAISFQNNFEEIDFKLDIRNPNTSSLSRSYKLDGDNCERISSMSKQIYPDKPLYFNIKSKNNPISSLRVWWFNGDKAKPLNQEKVGDNL
jgi:hypothetical protein